MRAGGIALTLLLLSCNPKNSEVPARILESSLSLSVVFEEQPRIGQALRLNVRIRNIGSREVDVIPPLDGSQDGDRFPHYFARLQGPVGNPEVPWSGKFCGNCTPLDQGNIIKLKPGEDMDPLVSSSYGPRLVPWIPRALGAHRLTLVVDFSATDPTQWNGQVERLEADGAKVAELLARVPRQKLEAVVEFDVVQ